MAIYKVGTAGMTAAGVVTGSGTQWQAALSLIRVGSTIMFMTNPPQVATISTIVSNTELRVTNNDGSVVPAGTKYAILLSDSLTVDGLAQDIAETLKYYQGKETEVATAIDNLKPNDYAKKANNLSDLTSASTARTNLGLDRVSQEPTRTTVGKSGGNRLFVSDNGTWGALNGSGSAVALPLSQGGTGANDAAGARTNLGLDNPSFGSISATGGVTLSNNSESVSPTFLTRVFDASGTTLRGTGEFRANANGNIEIINRLSGSVQAFSVKPNGRVESGGGWDGNFGVYGVTTVGNGDDQAYPGMRMQLGKFSSGESVPSATVGGMGIFEYSMVSGSVSVLNFLRRRKDGSTSGQIAVTFPNSSGTLALQGTSGLQYKKDIADADLKEAADRIDAMRMVNFVYKDDEQGRVRFGVIAEEAEKIAPQYIKHNDMPVDDILDDEGNKIGQKTVDRPTVDINPIVMDLMGYVKLLRSDLSDQKVAFESKIENLEAEIAEMKASIESLASKE